MSIVLFDKEAKISTSVVYFAYTILKVFEERKVSQMSFFKLVKQLKNLDPTADERQLLFGLMFLHSVDLLNMNGHLIEVVKS